MLPNNGLLTQLHAAILLAHRGSARADEALSLLRLAKKTEPDMPQIYKDMARAYGLKGDDARADLAAAEFALATGDSELALEEGKDCARALQAWHPGMAAGQRLLTLCAAKKK